MTVVIALVANFEDYESNSSLFVNHARTYKRTGEVARQARGPYTIGPQAKNRVR